MSTRLRRAFCAGLVLAFTAAGCSRERTAGTDEHGHDHGAGAAEHVVRGPHGGRLFEGDGMHLELQIFEEGVPPEYRAYLTTEKNEPLSLEGVILSVALDRFGGRRDSLLFRPVGDHLQSTSTVDEPHSFVARIHLDRGGRRKTWSYEQVEGRVELSPEAVAAGGIETAVAGPRDIEVRIELPGEIKLNADRTVQVRPRYAGVVRALPRQLGDRVRAGAVLAVIHSNESLSEYPVVAPMGGTLVGRAAAVGEAVDHESVLFTLADLSTVWAYFPLYPQFAMRVREGQTVRVQTQGDAPLAAESRVNYVGPLLEQDTRISYGRATIDNSSRYWTPGLYVNAAITVARVTAVVAVPDEAIVRTARGPGVFRANGSTFELQPVELGRSDGEWTQITSGLRTGDRYVSKQAFLLKAELGKSEATHDH